jgi:sugar lactone lactonase YvrE
MNYKIITIFAGLTLTTTAFARTVPNSAAANLVLGKADFVSRLNSSPPTASSLSLPGGVVVDPMTRKVFVTDRGNDRVLRYGSADALANGAPAEAVLGQPDFTSRDFSDPPTSQSMRTPSSLFFDRFGQLWVADTNNNRVLRFSAAAQIRNGAAADRVYGQPGFTTNTDATTQSGMGSPIGVWVDASDRLWIADSDNNRVLRYDGITNRPNGANADAVLGQADFTSSTAGSGAMGLSDPYGLAVSPSGSLFVADASNNRVLHFKNAAALNNGAGANAVLGQHDFTTNSPGLSAIQMYLPWGLTTTPDDSLWVCDSANSRMIRFDRVSSKPNGAAADGVIGQSDFTSAQSLNFPFYSPFVDINGSLWVPDTFDNRVLRYPAVASLPVVAVRSKFIKPITKPNAILKGTASDPNGIAFVQYRIGKGPLKTATGTTAWQIRTPLKKGKNLITVTATDPWGDVSRGKIIKITRK